MIFTSTFGRGRPIDPVLFTPMSGLQWVAVGASERPYPSKTLPPLRLSKVSLVSRNNGADPEIQALIERRLTFPSFTSGRLLMALYNVGTPGKIVGLYLWMFSSTSGISRALGTITIVALNDIAMLMPAT